MIPPQRVTSACRQSTQPQQVAEVGRHVGVLAGRDVERRASRTRRRPSKSAELTGSSCQVTPHSRAKRSAQRTACLRESAPFESTYSSTSSPIAERAASSRSGSRSGSRETFIFTRGMPCSTQPASCSRIRSSEYEVKPPLP